MSNETTTAVPSTPDLPTTSAAPITDSPLDSGSGEVVSEVDWEKVSDENEDGQDIAEAEYVEPTPAPTVVPPAEPAKVEPVVAPVAEPVKVETPVVPPVVPPAEPANPVDFAAEEIRIRGELEKMYAVSEEEALAFQTEPELVLPKMAANLHMQITKDVLAGIQSIMPQLIQRVQHVSVVETQAKDMFYETNPDLAKPELTDAIFQCGKLFRQVNPNAPADVAAKRIGDMVRQAMGMNAPVAQTEQPVTGSPVAPVQSAPRIVPFSPTRGGGNAPAVKPLSEWEQLANDDD